MLSFLITVGILSILIIAHEFGHFLAARKSGIKVEKFAIGFGPTLIKFKHKDTDILVCLFPLGGYVKLAGDNRSEFKGQSYEFLSKPPGIKSRVVFAGPFFNYLMALVIFWIIAMLGIPYPQGPEAVVGKVLDGYPAKEAGLKEGDRVLEVEGKEVKYWSEMAYVIYRSSGSVSLKLKRDGKIMTIEVPLKRKEVADEFGRKREVSMIGIVPLGNVKIVKFNFFKALLVGAFSLFNLTFLVLKAFAFMLLGIIPLREGIAGPLGIYVITQEAIKLGFVAILRLMAVLNVSLTIVNLFPFPILDGGHLVIFLVEKIRGRRLSQRVDDIISRIGFAIIGLLIVFVLYNDVMRFGSRIWNRNNTESTSDVSNER